MSYELSAKFAGSIPPVVVGLSGVVVVIRVPVGPPLDEIPPPVSAGDPPPRQGGLLVPVPEQRSEDEVVCTLKCLSVGLRHVDLIQNVDESTVRDFRLADLHQSTILGLRERQNLILL